MKIEVLSEGLSRANGSILLSVGGSDHNDYEIMSPEEAVAFAIKLSNLAYPLTKAVQRYTNGGCHRK